MALTLSDSDTIALSWVLEEFFASGHADSQVNAGPLFWFGISGNVTASIYLGESLQARSIGKAALETFRLTLKTHGLQEGALIQFCEPGWPSTHIFGMVMASNPL